MRRIRWHHLYVLLAIFDAIVILSGIWLHHQTVSALRDLLNHTAMLDAQQRDIAAISHALNQYSVPDAGITDPAQLAATRDSADQLTRELGALKSRSRLRGERVNEFWKLTAALTSDSQRLMRKADPHHAAPSADTRSAFAAIEQQRLRALRLLSGELESLLSQSARSHLNHAQFIDSQKSLERVLAALLVGTLGIVIWISKRLNWTDRKLQESERRAEAERIERLAAIGEVCTGVAHGIQNPLASISSSTEFMLEMGHMDANSRSRAEDVLAECGRLSRRVRRLLTFASLPESDRALIEFAPIICEVVREMSPRFEEKRITVNLEIEPQSILISADNDEIASILIELLSNALDHTPAGGQVCVRSKCVNGHVELEVADSGGGVPPATAPHIFDLFFTTRSGGSGVGLAWARRVPQSVGGSLQLLEGVEAGATFRLRLPIAENQKKAGGVPQKTLKRAARMNAVVETA